MQFIKNFFCHDNIVIGLSGIKKRTDFIKINIPESYKKSTVQKTLYNYILLWFYYF